MLEAFEDSYLGIEIVLELAGQSTLYNGLDRGKGTLFL